MPRNLDSAARSGDAEVLELPRRPLKAISLDDYLAREFPPRDNLLTPWLPSQGIAMVFAPRGVGKTHFALGVAYAVASGASFLRWSANKAARVLFIDGEMPAGTLHSRLTAILQAATCAPPPGHFHLLPYDLIRDGTPDLATDEGQRAIEPLLANIDLIVVDNISTTCSGKENEAEGWAAIQSWALTQRRNQRSVLFVHHAGKGGEQRGTSKREDIMDTVIRLSHPDDYEMEDGARFVVSFTKARGLLGADVAPFEARLSDGVWACCDAEDAHVSVVKEMLAEGKSIREIGKEVGLSKSKVARIKARLETDQ